VLLVRRGAKVGEVTWLSTLRERFRFRRRGQATRVPRTVWANPVAWREAKTRTTGGGLVRACIIIGGAAAAIALMVAYAQGTLSATELPRWLAALTIVQVAIVLLIATNTAATSMTKEKESQTMDLLLTTPLTSKYILWGKLRGLVSFAAPLLAGPLITLFVFAGYSLVKGDFPPLVWVETGLELGVLLILYTGLACVLGLRVSLTSRTNVTAVMYSIGLLIVICGVLTAGGLAFVEAARGEFGAFVAPFTPFTLTTYLVDPGSLFSSPKDFAEGAAATRLAALIGSAVAILLYSVIVWRSYAFLVRDFDMTMRKQSGM